MVITGLQTHSVVFLFVFWIDDLYLNDISTFTVNDIKLNPHINFSTLFHSCFGHLNYEKHSFELTTQKRTIS